jgi:hypothetical protein
LTTTLLTQIIGLSVLDNNAAHPVIYEGWHCTHRWKPLARPHDLISSFRKEVWAHKTSLILHDLISSFRKEVWAHKTSLILHDLISSFRKEVWAHKTSLILYDLIS